MNGIRSRKRNRKNGKALATLATALLLSLCYPEISALAAEKPSPPVELTVEQKNVANKVVHKVFVQGNKFSPEKDILAALPALREGLVLNVKNLSDEIMLANENSFRKIAIDLRPSGSNMLDAYVSVREAESAKFVVGVDNTGDDFTGQWRNRFTYIDGNIGGTGQTGIISYTTSPDHVSDVKQIGLYYNIPLPQAKDNMYFTASYSDTNSGRIISGDVYTIDASGKGSSVGLHYVRNLLRAPNAKQALDFGVDMRQYKNDTTLTVVGMPVGIGVDVDTLPLSVTYQGSLKRGNTFTSYSLGYVHNISQGSKNSTAQYELYRSGTAANYQIWRGNFNYQHMFSNQWLVNVVLTGQYTGERLIYPEQMGLGGAHSLRGMNERDISGDRGVQGNFELYTPEIAKGQRLVAFVDAGYIDNVKPISGDYTRDSAVACGIGWRGAFANGYSVSADFGYVLNGTVNTPEHSTKLHFLASKVF